MFTLTGAELLNYTFLIKFNLQGILKNIFWVLRLQDNYRTSNALLIYINLGQYYVVLINSICLQQILYVNMILL